MAKSRRLLQRVVSAVWTLVKLGSALGLVAGIWAIALYIVCQADLEKAKKLNFEELSTLLFGASSVAVFIFSSLIAILAIIGWQAIQGMIEARVAEVTRDRLGVLEKEMRGRVLTSLGYMVGEMSLKPWSLETQDATRLSYAVKLCEKAYGFLKDVGGPAEVLGLNNLLYYSAANKEKSEARCEFLLESARSLMKMGQKHDVIYLQLTACRVMVEYSEDSEDRARTKRALTKLLAHPEISDAEKKEARLYLEVLAKSDADSL